MGVGGCWKWGLQCWGCTDLSSLWQTPFCCWRLQTCLQLKEFTLAAFMGLLKPLRCFANQISSFPVLENLAGLTITSPSIVSHSPRQWFISFATVSKSFLCHFGIKNGSRLLSKRQNWSGSGAELLLLWEKRNKKILHCAAGWRFGMESCEEMDLLHHHSSKQFGFILRNCQRSEPFLSCDRYPQQEAAELWGCHRWCVGTNTLVWCGEGEWTPLCVQKRAAELGKDLEHIWWVAEGAEGAQAGEKDVQGGFYCSLQFPDGRV